MAEAHDDEVLVDPHGNPLLSNDTEDMTDHEDAVNAEERRDEMIERQLARRRAEERRSTLHHYDSITGEPIDLDEADELEADELEEQIEEFEDEIEYDQLTGATAVGRQPDRNPLIRFVAIPVFNATVSVLSFELRIGQFWYQMIRNLVRPENHQPPSDDA